VTTAVEPPRSFFAEIRSLYRGTGSVAPRDKAGGLRTPVIALGTAVVVAAIVLRFWTPSALWLDEGISVNISKLPITQIPRALSHDGAPPLYYVVLHYWMLVFGQSDFAVRALSGVVSVATLPFFWAAGKRVGGRRTAWVTFFIAACSPFAIYYATNARMYSFMILWALLGFLAMVRLFEAPTRRRQVALGAVTAATLYTHYWGLYLVFVTGLWLLFRMWRETRTGQPDRWPVRSALAAMVVGSLVFLPWSPVFVYQALHTGTPWSGAAGPDNLLQVFSDFSGPGPWGALLMFLLFSLIVVALFGRPGEGTPLDASGRRAAAITLELRPRAGVLPLFGITAGTVAVAVVLGAVANVAFVARYTAVILPLFLLMVAIGITTFRDRRAVAAITAVVCLAGLLTGFGQDQSQRTQAVQVAAVLNAQAQPGDLVVYCPDQLGPAVDRLLRVPDVTELTFPRAIGPQRVDWVDYTKVINNTNVAAFAQNMLSRLDPNHTLWFVWRNGYDGLGGSCQALDNWFNLLKPGGTTVVGQNGSYYEFENLVRFPS
jgi:mannosyltransferase